MANLVLKKACKELAKTHGKRFPDSTIEALNKVIGELIEKAAKRAESNGRKTIMAFDL